MPEKQKTTPKKSKAKPATSKPAPAPIDSDLMELPLDKLMDNPFQPRLSMDDVSLAELTESVKSKGILQPVLVKKKTDKDNMYTLIAGHRRVQAARNAKLKTIPARLVSADSKELLELALIENLQRDSLNPIEEAYAYLSLMDEFSYTQEEVAKSVGKGRSTITNTLRLLSLPEAAKQALLGNLIDAGHARALLSLPDLEQQLSALDVILENGLTVRESEALTRSHKQAGSSSKNTKKKSPSTPDPHLRDIERLLQSRCGTKVSLFPLKNNRGKIEIEYYSTSDLERIMYIVGVDRESL
jgi:ParB family transcriptional regulator, chromosome partitioning protein